MSTTEHKGSRSRTRAARQASRGAASKTRNRAMTGQQKCTLHGILVVMLLRCRLQGKNLRRIVAQNLYLVSYEYHARVYSSTPWGRERSGIVITGK